MNTNQIYHEDTHQTITVWDDGEVSIYPERSDDATVDADLLITIIRMLPEDDMNYIKDNLP